MGRSLNRAILIGNLTRDPDYNKTKDDTSVCSFSIATDRAFSTASGERKEETEFHRIVAWQKLADICGTLLKKGKKVYVEGRLSTKKYIDKDGIERTSTEIIASDMIILSEKRDEVEV